MTRPNPGAELRALYAELPPIDCRGQCQDSCSSIGMTQLEQDRIAVRHGRTLPLAAWFPNGCPALTMLGRCSIHADRPMVCRMWGLVPSMRCPHGCLPEGGLLDEAEGLRLMARAIEISERPS